MTAEQRAAVKRAIDQHVRATIKRPARTHGGECAGCGTDLYNRTQGCRTCYTRERKRLHYHTNHEYRQRKLQRDRSRKR